MMDNHIIIKNTENMVPANYLSVATDARRTRENQFRLLLEKKKIPDTGWSDDFIEEFVNYLSSLDSNNFPNKCGLGEREARIACKLVAKRHHNFAHGIGRSGDLLEAQPKAAGSTLLASLTNALLLDFLKLTGIHNIKLCFLTPMATGMTLNLCFLSLKKSRPQAIYVLWSRIDQKSCFKSITTAGLIPVIIEPKSTPIGLCTDVAEFEKQIQNLRSSILCIFSTTSCFSPRNSDDVLALAQLSKKYDIAHVVNNAYGLQSTKLTHQIEQGSRLGRIDLFVQSTDKNLMVPVGGAIVAGFDYNVVQNVAKTYVGRATSSATLDVFMTLLSLGRTGYLELLSRRKELFQYLLEELKNFAEKYGEKVFQTKRNPISIAVTLTTISNPTMLGSKLYLRGISGVRVVSSLEAKTIDSHNFEGWGSHCTDLGTPYFTVAAALGVTQVEIQNFLKKLEKCFNEVKLANAVQKTENDNFE